MQYSDIRNSICSGDLLGFSHEGWSSVKDVKSQIVRIATRSEFSHIGIAVVLSGRVFVLEAVVPCVRLFPLSKYDSFYHIPLEAKWTDEIEKKAFSHIGDKYSQFAAIKAFFVSLGKGNTQECAALAITVASYAGIDLGSRDTPDAVMEAAQRFGFPTYYIENKGNR